VGRAKRGNRTISGRGKRVEQTAALALIVLAGIGMFALLMILRRQRHDVEEADKESPYAVSTEGLKVCPKCGYGNLWTDSTCAVCGTHLKG
jgi:hypothetical protein